MHPAAFSWVAQHATSEPVRMLDIGGRDINGSVRTLFPNADYTSIDLYDGEGVDLVADVTTYRPRKKYDLIVCCEVLEHTPDPAGILDVAHRLLRGAGKLILTAASEGREPHSAMDGAQLQVGEHYANITRPNLERMLKGWSDVTIDVTGTDIRATAVK